MARSSSSAWSQVIQNRLVALVLAMIVFVPFIATTTDQESHGVAALSFEGFSILLLATLIWRAKWKFSRETVVGFLKTAGNTPILLFGALTVVSCILAPVKGKEYAIQETLRTLAGIMLYFTVAYQFRRSEQQTRLIDVVMFVAIGASAIGLFQFGLSPAEQQFSSGLFGDHQLYGSFLMLLLPIVAVVAITERSPNRQLIAQIGTLFTIIALLVSHSRSAWIGGSAGMAALGVIAIYLSTKKVSAAARRHELVVPLMLIVVSVGFFMLVSPQAKSIVDRASSIRNVESDRGWQYRQQAWRGAEAMIREHPILGVGIGQYAVEQEKYSFTGRPAFFFNATNRAGAGLGEQAHNFYLQTAAELGLPGLVLLLAALSAFLGSALQKVSTMDAGTRRTLLLGSMAAIIAFAVDAFGSPAWQYGQVSMFFWLVLGIGTGCLRPRAKHIARPLPEDSAPKSTKVSRATAILATLGLAAFLPTVALATIPTYLIPQSATISPLNATIPRGNAQPYTLLVTFTDPTHGGATVGPFDVTLQPTVTNGSGMVITQTNFTETGGDGSMTDVNNHVYQSLARENDTPTITGTYLQNGVTVSATTTATVGSG